MTKTRSDLLQLGIRSLWPWLVSASGNEYFRADWITPIQGFIFYILTQRIKTNPSMKGAEE